MALGRFVNREYTQIDCDQIGNLAPAGSPAVVVPLTSRSSQPLLVGIQEAEEIAVMVGDAARSGNSRRIRLLALRHWVR